MHIKEYDKIIQEFLEERGWNNLRPSDMAKGIAIEAAEILQIFQWDNPELEKFRNDAERIEKLKNELADVLNYCFELSALMEFDTEKIMTAKLEKVKQKYLPEIVKSDVGDPGTGDLYWKLKNKKRIEELTEKENDK